MNDLHDTGRELQDPNIWRLLHFGAGIEETVRRYTGVGID